MSLHRAVEPGRRSPGVTGIPSNAIDRADYASTSAFFAAMRAQDVPGKIGSGVYNITSSDKETIVTTSLYGYGATKPIFRGSAVADVPAFLHIQADNVTITGVRFEKIFCPIACRHSSYDQWTDSANWRPFAQTSSAMNYNSDLVGLDVSGNEFSEVALCVLIAGETNDKTDITFSGNVVRDSSGGFTMRAPSFSDVYVEDNDFRDMVASAYNSSSDYTETVFMIGRSNDELLYGQNTGVYVRRNYVDGYVSTHGENGKNAATVVDIRICGTVRIEDNDFRNCYNTGGSSDSQAVYLKCKGDIIFRRNRYENCGGPGVDASNEGSEGMVYAFKGNSDDILSEDDVFIGGTNSKNNPFISIGTANNVQFVRSTFQDWTNDGTWFKNGPRGMVRNWSGGPMNISAPTVTDCGYTGTTTYFVIHRNNAVGPVTHADWAVNWNGTNERNIIYNDAGITVNLSNCTNAIGETIQIDT